MTNVGLIGLIGDLHGHWDDWDARYFSRSPYELLLFTGDLGSGTRDDGVRIARSVGRLGKPALVMPGNNDAAHAPAIAAELGHQRGLQALLHSARGLHIPSLSAASGQVRLCGYSAHALCLGGRNLTLLAARPHAMGGDELSFPVRLRESYGIESIADSAARLCALVDKSPTEELIFLAHNGPHGLGGRAVDLWGCDFRPEHGDFGDTDLAEAIAHARRVGKRVLAVVAGHMHRLTRTAEMRPFCLEIEGTLYINPADVPRIRGGANGMLRHHAVLEVSQDAIVAREVFVEEGDG
ncbi:MAG: hypothetical protein RL385_4417 [Pseudomonadota bacterium]|jgi:uncharacterized protein (TIGR04168 family)